MAEAAASASSATAAATPPLGQLRSAVPVSEFVALSPTREHASNAAAASASAPAVAHTSHSNLHSPLASRNSTALTTLLGLADVQLRYSDAPNAFMTARVEHDKAVADLATFTAKCKPNAPAIQLPRSLRMTLVKKVKWTPVAEQEKFYAADNAMLEQIEREASIKIFDAITEGKKRRIAHLAAACNVRAFTAQATQLYEDFVRSQTAYFNSVYGAEIDPSSASSLATPADSFPVREAVAHFAQHLETQIMGLVMLKGAELIALQEKKLLAAQAEREAQETVMAGAHSGQTIKKVVDRSIDDRQPLVDKRVIEQVDKRFAQLAKPLAQHAQPNQKPKTARPVQPPKAKATAANALASAHPSTSAAAAAPASKVQSHKSRRHTAKRSAEVDGEDLQQADQKTRTVHSAEKPGHAANSAQSKNAQGGDRHKQAKPAQAKPRHEGKGKGKGKQ